jgi:uncharacterized glyoxalase superfamily protein PhnB
MATRKRSAAAKRRPAAAGRQAAKPAGAAAKRAGVKRAAAKKAVAKRRPVRAKPESLRLRSMMASLTVGDIDLSVRFYRDALGFTVEDEWRENGKVVGYMLKAGNVEIGIGQDDWAKGRDRLKGVGSRLYCETTQDVDALAARVRAAGYRLVEPPKDHSWGSRSFAVDDPDGFRISIFKKIRK